VHHIVETRKPQALGTGAFLWVMGFDLVIHAA
jgi:hypothetical protein